jgi:hypothetical protein
MRSALLLGATLLAVAACTSADRPRVQPDQVPLPTPMRSFDAAVGATIAQLEAVLAASGTRLETPDVAYRTTEPQSLLQVPRVVRRAELADPDDGFIVVYQADDPGAARTRGEELAGYLESGFGQANFSADTQFSVAVLGETVIFTSWSSGRSDDPERAEAVFDAVARVGQPIAVNK